MRKWIVTIELEETFEEPLTRKEIMECVTLDVPDYIKVTSVELRSKE